MPEHATDRARADLVTNASMVRTEEQDGKRYLVAPMIMIVEGVTNGILYTDQDLAKFPSAWNGRPVVIQHPTKQGKFASANSPDVTKVGTIYNTTYADGKLRAEAWLDEDMLAKVDKQVAAILKMNGKVEVSTGLFYESEPTEGDHGDKHFHAIARNHCPDHLAILPNQKGACSWEDGAGMPRVNQQLPEEGSMPTFTEALTAVREFISNAVGGVLSAREEEKALLKALQDKLPPGDSIYIVDLFPHEVIYERHGSGPGGEAPAVTSRSRIFRQKFTRGKKGIPVLDGTAQEVTLQTSYVPAANAADESTDNTNQQENVNMERKERITALVSNGKAVEADTEHLMALNDATFDALFPVANKLFTKDDNPTKDKEDEEEGKKAKAKNAKKAKNMDEEEDDEDEPKANRKVTVNEFIANAPAEVRESLERMVATDQARKADLVKTIAANKRNKFSDDELNAMAVNELEKIADMVVPEQANYGGRSGSPAPAVNQATVEPLLMPVLPSK